MTKNKLAILAPLLVIALEDKNTQHSSDVKKVSIKTQHYLLSALLVILLMLIFLFTSEIYDKCIKEKQVNIWDQDLGHAGRDDNNELGAPLQEPNAAQYINVEDVNPYPQP